MNQKQLERMSGGKGFIAALDQSGGSSPKALQRYGIEPGAWSSDEEMYDLMHEMRTRMMKSPSFDNRILGAILFETPWTVRWTEKTPPTSCGKKKASSRS